MLRMHVCVGLVADVNHIRPSTRSTSTPYTIYLTLLFGLASHRRNLPTRLGIRLYYITTTSRHSCRPSRRERRSSPSCPSRRARRRRASRGTRLLSHHYCLYTPFCCDTGRYLSKVCRVPSTCSSYSELLAKQLWDQSAAIAGVPADVQGKYRPE